jgi:hypothetical protein
MRFVILLSKQMEDRMSETNPPAGGTQTATGSGNGTQPGQQPGGGGPPPPNGAMAALGELICRLNPYTELPYDSATHMETGPMEVVTLPKPSGYTPSQANDTIACMGVEAERNYNTSWTFKGQTQNVKAAFRIPYRFEVRDEHHKVKYWQTEYLLIGYAGGDGPG